MPPKFSKNTQLNAMKRSKGSKVMKPGKKNLKKSSKSTKLQIRKLDANIDEVDEIKMLLHTNTKQSTRNVFDSKQLEVDLNKDKQNIALNKQAEENLKLQVDLINGMAL